MSGAPVPKTGIKSTQGQRKRSRDRELERAKAVVRKRSGGRCEVKIDGVRCTRRRVSTHHKIGRVHPDGHRPENLLGCCLECHARIHAEPEWAYAQGYLESRTS